MQIQVCLIVIAVIGGCAPIRTQPPAPDVAHGAQSGYLEKHELPDSLALLPPPPASESASFSRDKDINAKGLALRGTARWEMAVKDANRKFPAAADIFSCALGIDVSGEKTPKLYVLLNRVMEDAESTTHKAKRHYQRPRPFMVNGEPTCTPEVEGHLRKEGSYPSGHSSTGWAWALVLCEVAPERTDRILARGRAYGESRIICNAHWQSDVDQGRIMAAAAVARMHTDPEFQEDLRAARREYEQVFARGVQPHQDCEAQDRALKTDPSAMP